MPTFLQNRTYYLSESVAVAKIKLRENTPPHRHDFIEIVYMLRGRCTHTIDGASYPVSRGHMLIVNYGQTHSITGDPDSEYFNIYLKPDFIDSSLTSEKNAFSLLRLSKFEEFRDAVNQNNQVFSFSGEERTVVETWIEQAYRELREKPAGWQLSVESTINLLLIRLFRQMSLPIFPAERRISIELLNYIREHCHESLSLKDLSARHFYNPSYFSRVFKQYTGYTLTEFIKIARLERAALLLCDTAMTVSDVCAAVGYHDKTKFFRDFKQAYDLSPAAYRKNRT